jgi:hypothetical protein
MEESRMPKNMLYCQMIGARRKGRPRKRWRQDVEEDLNILLVRNWIAKAKQRHVWRSKPTLTFRAAGEELLATGSVFLDSQQSRDAQLE